MSTKNSHFTSFRRVFFPTKMHFMLKSCSRRIFKNPFNLNIKRSCCAISVLIPDVPQVFKRFHSKDAKDVDDLIVSVKSVVEHDQFKNASTKSKLFVLQPRMQYKSKSRQSMSAELQLEEAVSLIETLHEFEIVDTHIASTKAVNSRAIWGSGNIESLSRKIAESGAEALFVGIDKLSSMQIETLKQELLGNNPATRIYDRYTIVLKIFKKHARSSIAKLQIALAEIPYLRDRFVDSDLYIDTEKRLKLEIDKQIETRSLLTKTRQKTNIPTVSIIGYTNVGKTTLIKYLTQDDKLKPENKLFATLDVTFHGTCLPNSKLNVIFVDTIGFISDIPHSLINAFKVTLQDALDADLLVHVVDCTHPEFESQEQVVLGILEELKAGSKISNMLTVYNKYDKVAHKSHRHLKTLLNRPNSLAISCMTGYGIGDLVAAIEAKLTDIRNYLKLKLKIKQGSNEIKYLYKNCIIQNIELIDDDMENFVLVHVLFDKQTAIKFTNTFPSVKVIR